MTQIRQIRRNGFLLIGSKLMHFLDYCYSLVFIVEVRKHCMSFGHDTVVDQYFLLHWVWIVSSCYSVFVDLITRLLVNSAEQQTNLRPFETCGPCSLHSWGNFIYQARIWQLSSSLSSLGDAVPSNNTYRVSPPNAVWRWCGGTVMERHRTL